MEIFPSPMVREFGTNGHLDAIGEVILVLRTLRVRYKYTVYSVVPLPFKLAYACYRITSVREG